MRIGIREQLAVVVLLSALVPLAALAIATWINNLNFVKDVTSNSLTLTASLKAAQIAQDLLLIQATCNTIVTRILLQSALHGFYSGNDTSANWSAAETDVAGALASGGLSALLQVTVFSRNETGDPNGILNATLNASGIVLPFTNPNGSSVLLGQPGLGYPQALYPNITYILTDQPDPSDPTANLTIASAFSDLPLNASSYLFLGPLQINTSYALVSLTLPILDNADNNNVLGYMTVVAAATSLIDVISSREGLGNTGIVLIAGPNRRENQFHYESRPATPQEPGNKTQLEITTIKYVFPPYPIPGQSDRHSVYNSNLTAYGSSNFTEGQYPAILRGFGRVNPEINNSSAMISTSNENNASVAVGYARIQSNLVNWLLIIEQNHSEAWAPIYHLRNIVLACVFGSVGLVLLIVIPLAHYSVAPIRRLRDATKKTVAPPSLSPEGSMRSGASSIDGEYLEGDEEIAAGGSQRSKKKGILVRLRDLTRGKKKTHKERTEEERRRVFKIPGKVQDRKHFIKDELTDLTTTFNDMSDELSLQYTRLEEKVAERTRQLETSKRAAEAANESKTLFIANISHELKTPLNGILGMASVCMGDDDLGRIKRSLQILYMSGDLLLHLLNDLLTFSKNQIGQQLTLEEKEFRLADVKSQIINIFQPQVQEKSIDFAIRFVGTDATGDVALDSALDQNQDQKTTLPALGPQGTGRLKDMCLWGDQHRILQVIINLVSNSLKFTPDRGKVEVRIRCLGETEAPIEASNRNSLGSKQSSQKGSRHRHRNGSGSNNSQTSRKASSHANNAKPAGTALLINPMDPRSIGRIQVRDRSASPPPSNTKTLTFEFEVEDSGPGIPEHLRERVFEPFVQGDLGLSKKYGGTGLGLSICSQLAGLMGGSISLQSTIGVGSTFNMKIPLKFVKERAASTSSSDIAQGSRPGSVYNQSGPDASRRPGSPKGAESSAMGFDQDVRPRLVGLSQPFFAATPSPSVVPKGSQPAEQMAALDRAMSQRKGSSKVRVLVAEDNLVNQEVVLRMLKLEDIYDVVVAKDGQEAYDMVKENMNAGKYFNLIFMDIQMPNLDGLQSTRLIRQMGYSAPIVALTAFAEDSNVKECHEAGMDMFLSKPIRRPALKQVLKKFATIPEENESPSSTGLPSTAVPAMNGANGSSESRPQEKEPPTPVPNSVPT